MGFFPDTIAARLSGRVVRVARLVQLDFADETGRYWEGGTGILATNDGNRWLGAGELGSISGVESALGGTAPQVTLTLSGASSTHIRESIAAETNVKGRDATIFVQFFDEETLAPLDNPYAVFLGIMDVMTIKTDGPTTWTIELTVESLFTKRAMPPWGYLSDRSQQAKYPGDTGLSEMGHMRFDMPFWPVYG